jgi:hypothetical protein
VIALLALLGGSPGGTAGSYTPDLDKILLVVGQNVESITGYAGAVGLRAGGIMSYTSTASAEGLSTAASYGAGLIHAQYFVDNPDYSNTVIQLGLYVNNDLGNIISGARAANLTAIGNWIKNTGRPVYLRIGYEFDAPWNALLPEQYVTAYRHIVDVMRAGGVTNVAFVWHAACSPTFGGNPYSAWYPGDDYVDWAGISVFHQFDGTLGTVSDIDNFCAFAKTRHKPIMIAESTPFGGISNARWADWFAPCLELIRRHHIQMWCYINADWDAQPMFAGQGWGDCRIQQNAFVLSNWLATIESTAFLKRSPELFPRLHFKATNCWREAESANLSGASLCGDALASGGIAVGGLDAPGRTVAFSNGGAARQFILRYAATNSGTLGLYLNSQPRRSLPIAATGGGYRDLLVHEIIPAGATVAFRFDAGDISLNLDTVLFRGYEDSDGDGLPDDWEKWRLGSMAYGPNDDPDGDGSPNGSEFVADTEPLNAASSMRIDAFSLKSGEATVVSAVASNRVCFVQQSSDLTNWVFAPLGMSTNVAVGNTSSKIFLRLHVP